MTDDTGGDTNDRRYRSHERQTTPEETRTTGDTGAMNNRRHRRRHDEPQEIYYY